jgi:SAM-dependent methyltransferase
MTPDPATTQTAVLCAALEPQPGRPSLEAQPGKRSRSPLASFNRQFARPQGALGRLAGWIMARENVRANHLVVEELAVGPDDRVLEIGCGPGVALAAAHARAGRGLVVGIDPSAVMVAQARRRLRAAIRSGEVAVTCAAAESVSYPADTFTRAFTVNTIDHWTSIPTGLSELRRVLAPGARLSIGLRRERAQAGRDPHAHGASERDIAALCAQLAEAGFSEVEVRDHDLGREILAIVSATRAAV